jgi:hypothetical protein
MRKPEPGAAGKHQRDRQSEEALQHANQGKLDIKYGPDEYLVRVSRTR